MHWFCSRFRARQKKTHSWFTMSIRGQLTVKYPWLRIQCRCVSWPFVSPTTNKHQRQKKNKENLYHLRRDARLRLYLFDYANELISTFVPFPDPTHGHKWRQLQARHTEAKGSRVFAVGWRWNCNKMYVLLWSIMWFYRMNCYSRCFNCFSGNSSTQINKRQRRVRILMNLVHLVAHDLSPRQIRNGMRNERLPL